MNTTKNAILAIKTAFQKGYRVTTQGDVISPKGIVLRGMFIRVEKTNTILLEFVTMAVQQSSLHIEWLLISNTEN
jgi:hypothetical protein